MSRLCFSYLFTFFFQNYFQTELNLELLVKDEPIDWEESMDPSESLTIDHEIDIKPVSICGVAVTDLNIASLETYCLTL